MVRSLLGIPAEEERKRAFRIVFGTAVGAAVAAGADYEEESLGGREDCREEMRHPRISVSYTHLDVYKRQRQGEVMARQLQRKQDEYQEDVNAAQGEVFDRIGRKMVDVLDRYARENGYVVILDSSAQNTPILFASTNIDVTQDIIRLFDGAYPVKTGNATPAKPAAKPATPPAQKPPQR